VTSDDAEPRPGVQLPRFFLKRGDQLTAAMLTAFALAALAIYWWRQGGLQGRLVEVEQLKPRPVEFRVNPNTADWPEIAQIPEIGETLAKRIIEYRTAHGPYANVDSLLAVPGIGPRTLELMRPHVDLPANTPAAPAETAP
jgi:competence protein ComEA